MFFPFVLFNLCKFFRHAILNFESLNVCFSINFKIYAFLTMFIHCNLYLALSFAVRQSRHVAYLSCSSKAGLFYP